MALLTRDPYHAEGPATPDVQPRDSETKRRSFVWEHPWSLAALAFCIAFGLALIANIQLVGDGSWYWYAVLARHGFHLYSDLKFTLQPFFVLETEWFQTLFGTSWIASRVPAVLNLLGLTLGIYSIALRARLSDRQRAIVVLFGFFVGIRFEAYRLDDYHVATDAFVIFSALLLLIFEQTYRRSRQLNLVVLLGLLSGLTTMTRINDGAMLFAFSVIAILCLAKSDRFILAAVYSICVAVTSATVISMTGDSLVTWATYSVLHVGANKGGGSQLLADPGHLFTSAWSFAIADGRTIFFTALTASLAWVFLIACFDTKHWKGSLVKAAAGAAVGAVALYTLWPHIADGTLDLSLEALLTLAVFVLPVVVIVRAARSAMRTHSKSRWNPREILLLLPLAMMASGSLSSAGLFNDLYMDGVLLVLFVPVVSEIPKRRSRSIILSLALLAAFSAAWYRFNDPASWISYATYPLFQNRQIVRHPLYGPTVIDKRTLSFINNICPTVEDGAANPQLLSIPWPFANYYCGIAPWHNIVQTWFDTSGQVQINDLMAQLETAPPKWILYQRQIGTLGYHEFLYNSGQRIPQRDLDEYFMRKVTDGEWRIVYREQYGIDSDWMLVRTSWGESHGANLLHNPIGAQALSGWNVTSGAPSWSTAGGALFVVKQPDPSEDSIEESALTHPITFARSGPTTIALTTRAHNFLSSAGSGYTADLYDPATGLVIGSLGWSNWNSPARRYSFEANVEAGHLYALRLRFNAPAGDVAFYNITIAGVDGESVGTSRLNGWNAPATVPKWSAAAGSIGCFNVSHDGGIAQSTLSQQLAFAKGGTVAVRLQIGASALDPTGGYGYVVDLYDATTKTVVNSIGVPAVESALKPYAFAGEIKTSDRYRLRLRFKGTAGNVTFCRLKLEYGTLPTAWSDESTARLKTGRRAVQGR